MKKVFGLLLFCGLLAGCELWPQTTTVFSERLDIYGSLPVEFRMERQELSGDYLYILSWGAETDAGILPLQLTFSSPLKLEASDVQKESLTGLTIPKLHLNLNTEVWTEITLGEKFWLFCWYKDHDDFVWFPTGSGIVKQGQFENLFWEDDFCHSLLQGAKYINHYWDDIGLHVYAPCYDMWGQEDNETPIKPERWTWWQGCLIEMGERKDFEPLAFPFSLNVSGASYTTFAFMKKLTEEAKCHPSLTYFKDHPYEQINFYTESIACDLRYTTGTTVQNIYLESL